jgi:hypothetical protein
MDIGASMGLRIGVIHAFYPSNSQAVSYTGRCCWRIHIQMQHYAPARRRERGIYTYVALLVVLKSITDS